MMWMRMGIEVTDDMVAMLQEYLGWFETYLHAGNTAGLWILAAGALTAAGVVISQMEQVRRFFRKKRIYK